MILPESQNKALQFALDSLLDYARELHRKTWLKNPERFLEGQEKHVI